MNRELKKILITGGNGFIAKHIYDQFKDSYDLVTCGRKELDLLDSEHVFKFLTASKFDIIIHTATYDAAPKTSTKDPQKVLENNLRMFFNLSRCSDFFGKLIFFGSGAEFSRDMWQPKMSESFFDENVPSDQYGFSKYLMTKHALQSDNIYNLRIFGLFGHYDDWRYRLIPNLCCRALFDLPLQLNKNFDYDFMYINDLVRIVEWVINNKPKQQVYNICSGQVHSFEEIAQKINNIAVKELEISVNDNITRLEYSGDNTLLLEELPRFEFTDIDSAIANLYHHYRDNLDEINKDEIL